MVYTDELSVADKPQRVALTVSGQSGTVTRNESVEGTTILTSPSTRRVHVQCHSYEKVAAAGNVVGFRTLQDYNNRNKQNEKCSGEKKRLLLSLHPPPPPHPIPVMGFRFGSEPHPHPYPAPSPAGAATSIIFVATNTTKHVFRRDKSMLVATKIILVAAPANDTPPSCSKFNLSVLATILC